MELLTLEKVEALKAAITDAYIRMATNRDPAYRATQMEKVNGWLEELTQLLEPVGGYEALRPIDYEGENVIGGGMNG